MVDDVGVVIFEHVVGGDVGVVVQLVCGLWYVVCVLLYHVSQYFLPGLDLP